MLGLRRPHTVRTTTAPVVDSRPTSVYGAYNHANQLIYIGITHDLERRWQQHRDDKPWIAEVAQWREIARYPTRAQAKAHETWVITNQPTRWNIDESPWAAQVCQLYRDLYHCQPGTNTPCTPQRQRHAATRALLWTLHAAGWAIVTILWLAWVLITFTTRLAYDVARHLGAPLPHLHRARRRHPPTRRRSRRH